MFTSIEKKLKGKTTSLVERVMKTVNFRINVGKWSEKGALNVNKIRLSYYYNDYDVQPFDDTDIIIENMSNTMKKNSFKKTKKIR